MARTDVEKGQGHMGLTMWVNAPNGKILKPDVSVAKNYLNEMEMEELGCIINVGLDLAESCALHHIQKTMEDWSRHAFHDWKSRKDKCLKIFDIWRKMISSRHKIFDNCY